MTYCVAIKLNAGLVFLADSRTNAGIDQISSFRKLMIYERPGERFMVLLSAGNLSISQSVREVLQTTQIRDPEQPGEPVTIWNAGSLYDAARVVGHAVRSVHERDGEALRQAGVDFNVSLIFGGHTPSFTAVSRIRARSSRSLYGHTWMIWLSGPISVCQNTASGE